MPGDSPVLLGIPDIKLLGILKITYKAVGDQKEDRKCDSQTIQPSNSSSCKVNTDWWIKTDNADAVDTNSNMSVYVRSRSNRAAGKRANQVLRQKCTMN